MCLSETGEGSKDENSTGTLVEHFILRPSRLWLSLPQLCVQPVKERVQLFSSKFFLALCDVFDILSRREALTRGLCAHPRASCARVAGRLLFTWQRMSLQLKSCHPECFVIAVMRFSGAANLRAVPWPRNSRTQSASGISAGEKQCSSS